MFQEALFIVPQLSLFALTLFCVFAFQNIRFLERLQYLGIFFLYSLGFYSFFYLNSHSYPALEKCKTFVFGQYYLLLALGISLSVFFYKRDRKLLTFFLTLFLSPYLYFLFFGMENFHIWNWKFTSLGIWKAQNPIIGVLLVPILLFPWFWAQIPLFLVFWAVSFYISVNAKNQLWKVLDQEVVHSKYIAHEFFLDGNSLLVEEEMGIYNFIRPIEVEEPIYKFTLKPLRRLNQAQRLPVQKVVDVLEFPIVIKEDNTITIYELSKSFQGEMFRVVYDLESGKLGTEGPIF